MERMDQSLRLADRIFRLAGVVTILGLVATIALAVSGAAIWRPVFTASHVTALVALVPLGAVLVTLAYREAGGLGPMLSRHLRIVIALAVIAVSVTVTLVEFDGNRTVRRFSNFTTVGLVLLLIVHYVRWYGARSAGDSGRRTAAAR